MGSAGPEFQESPDGQFQEPWGIAVDDEGKGLRSWTKVARTCHPRFQYLLNIFRTLHKALEFYSQGKYLESKKLWEEVMIYDGYSKIAHYGLGKHISKKEITELQQRNLKRLMREEIIQMHIGKLETNSYKRMQGPFC